MLMLNMDRDWTGEVSKCKRELNTHFYAFFFSTFGTVWCDMPNMTIRHTWRAAKGPICDLKKKDHTEIWIMQTYSESQEKNM